MAECLLAKMPGSVDQQQGRRHLIPFDSHIFQRKIIDKCIIHMTLNVFNVI